MNELYALLDRYTAAGDAPAAAAVEAELWRRWGVDRAVLVLDMSGFSRLVRRWGIVHYLSLVRQMHRVTEPLVHATGGEVVKFEADNLYAAFADTESAVTAARAIRAAFRDLNLRLPADRDIHVAIGVAWGRILLMPGQDYFGDAVNIACKLGEDLAERGEILVDAKAFETLPVDARQGFEHSTWSISGLQLDAWLLPAA